MDLSEKNVLVNTCIFVIFPYLQFIVSSRWETFVKSSIRLKLCLKTIKEMLFYSFKRSILILISFVFTKKLLDYSSCCWNRHQCRFRHRDGGVLLGPDDSVSRNGRPLWITSVHGYNYWVPILYPRHCLKSPHLDVGWMSCEPISRLVFRYAAPCLHLDVTHGNK